MTQLAGKRFVPIVDEKQHKYKLYLSPAQHNEGVDGRDLLKYLEHERIIDRCLSPMDIVVLDWIARPATYPVEFRKSPVYLWKYLLTYSPPHRTPRFSWESVVIPPHQTPVLCLFWNENNELEFRMTPLWGYFGSDHPALIRKAT